MICFTSNRSAIGLIHLSLQKLHTKTYHWIHQMCAPPSYVDVLIRITVKLVCTPHLQSAYCPTPFFPYKKKQPVKNKSNVRLHWWIQMSQKYKNKKLTAVLNIVSTETLTVSIIAIISALTSNLIWWKTSISSRIREQIFIFLKNNKIKKKIRCLLENIYKIKAFTISVRCKKNIYILLNLILTMRVCGL